MQQYRYGIISFLVVECISPDLVGLFETGIEKTKTRSNVFFFFSILKSMLCPPMACYHWMLGPSQTLQPPLSGFVWVRDRRYWSLNDKFWTDDIPILFPNYIFWSNEENSFVAQHLKMLRYLPNVLRNAVLNNYMRYACTLCTLVFVMDISTIYMVRQRHCGLLVWNYGELVIQPI